MTDAYVTLEHQHVCRLHSRPLRICLNFQNTALKQHTVEIGDLTINLAKSALLYFAGLFGQTAM